MKYIITAIYDLKSKQYGYLQTVTSLVESERTLIATMEKGNNNIAKFPQDFQLFKMADYDLTSGEITPLPKPILICNAIDHASAITPPVHKDDQILQEHFGVEKTKN